MDFKKFFSKQPKATVEFNKAKKHIQNKARYNVVSYPNELMRERGQPETGSEDTVLEPYDRLRMLNLARNTVRNSSMINSILKQLQNNVVGTNGGKIILENDNEKKITKEFSKFTRNADYFDGLNLNSLLRIILTQGLIAGECALVFDDNLVSDSGKILLFEADEIGNVSEEEIKIRFGKNAV